MFPSTQTNTLHDNGGIETKYMNDDSWTKLIFDNLANVPIELLGLYHVPSSKFLYVFVLRYTTKPVMNRFRR